MTDVGHAPTRGEMKPRLRADEARGLGRSLRPAVVAIDGPAASGKSTVGFALAEELDYLFFDTGVMYRAVTWAALQRGLNVEDAVQMAGLAVELPLDVRPPAAEEHDGRQCTVLIGVEDVTRAIRSPMVDGNVSVVSSHSAVREALASHQRRIALRYGSGAAEKAGIVMVGRDIGTVVMPEAPVKVYLDATAEERALRRCKEMVERGDAPGAADYERVLAEIIRRDRIDSSRAISPLRAAEDAVTVDTTQLMPIEVVQRILDLVRTTVKEDGAE